MADGTIVLKGIPFGVVKAVEIIVMEDVLFEEADRGSVKLPLDELWKSLQGSVTRYDDPFDPVSKSFRVGWVEE